MTKKSTSKKRQPVERKVKPVVGLRWVDTFDGAEYEISAVTEENISYGHTPGQGWISGGAHCLKAWKKRVASGQYIVQPNPLLGGWMPIDTAPHDNATWVLVWDGDQIDIAIFGRHPLDVQEEMALCWTDGDRELNPTYWMPLPDPPNPCVLPTSGPRW